MRTHIKNIMFSVSERWEERSRKQSGNVVCLHLQPFIAAFILSSYDFQQTEMWGMACKILKCFAVSYFYLAQDFTSKSPKCLLKWTEKQQIQQVLEWRHFV